MEEKTIVKTVYSYSPWDGIYIGRVLLDDSDRSPSGLWNIPAFCTEKEPLEEKEGFTIHFDQKDNEWKYEEIEKQEDYKLSLEELKEIKIYELKEQRKQLETAPIMYKDKEIDYDKESQFRMELVSELLEENDTNIKWTMTDNDEEQLTVADFKQIRLLAAQRVIDLHTKYNEVKILVESAKTEDDLKKIEITL